MYEYRVHTLVDITNNGNLAKKFPFQTFSGDVIHDKHSLAIARNQNSNFNTMIQLLQMRGNVTWEIQPERIEMPSLGNHGFGKFYQGKHTVWNFQFFVEQAGVYGEGDHATENLLQDFHNVPVVSFCKETATFPLSTFDCLNTETINTYFSYAGPTDK
jgi:hypothetical protein